MLDFAVIGFQKCGTDSARQWLLEHPEVAVPSSEVGPGIAPPFGISDRTPVQRFWDSLGDQPGAPDGIVEEGVLLGTVNPAYGLCDVAGNAKGLAGISPATTIVAFERPRIERAYSAWADLEGSGSRSFEDAIETCLTQGPSWKPDEWLHRSYVEAGEYDRIISEFQRYFEVVRLQMGDSTGLACALGIEERPFPHSHATTTYPDNPPSEKTLKQLEDYYSSRGES